MLHSCSRTRVLERVEWPLRDRTARRWLRAKYARTATDANSGWVIAVRSRATLFGAFAVSAVLPHVSVGEPLTYPDCASDLQPVRVSRMVLPSHWDRPRMRAWLSQQWAGVRVVVAVDGTTTEPYLVAGTTPAIARAAIDASKRFVFPAQTRQCESTIRLSYAWLDRAIDPRSTGN